MGKVSDLFDRDVEAENQESLLPLGSLRLLAKQPAPFTLTYDSFNMTYLPRNVPNVIDSATYPEFFAQAAADFTGSAPPQADYTECRWYTAEQTATRDNSLDVRIKFFCTGQTINQGAWIEHDIVDRMVVFDKDVNSFETVISTAAGEGLGNVVFFKGAYYVPKQDSAAVTDKLLVLAEGALVPDEVIAPFNFHHHQWHLGDDPAISWISSENAITDNLWVNGEHLYAVSGLLDGTVKKLYRTDNGTDWELYYDSASPVNGLTKIKLITVTPNKETVIIGSITSNLDYVIIKRRPDQSAWISLVTKSLINNQLTPSAFYRFRQALDTDLDGSFKHVRRIIGYPIHSRSTNEIIVSLKSVKALVKFGAQAANTNVVEVMAKINLTTGQVQFLNVVGESSPIQETVSTPNDNVLATIGTEYTGFMPLLHGGSVVTRLDSSKSRYAFIQFNQGNYTGWFDTEEVFVLFNYHLPLSESRAPVKYSINFPLGEPIQEVLSDDTMGYRAGAVRGLVHSPYSEQIGIDVRLKQTDNSALYAASLFTNLFAIDVEAATSFVLPAKNYNPQDLAGHYFTKVK